MPGTSRAYVSRTVTLALMPDHNSQQLQQAWVALMCNQTAAQLCTHQCRPECLLVLA